MGPGQHPQSHNHHHNQNHNHNYSQQIINQERGGVTGDNITIESELSNPGQQQQINGNQLVKIDII